jgi:hypothetical protein
MYVGHFATGMALTAKAPRGAALPILLGVGFIDILDGLLIVAGLDTVTPNLRSGPYLYFDLTFIDWDHSLLMAGVWSVAWALLFVKDRSIGLLAGAAAFSHFLADWPVHNGDLALYPYAAEHLGFGLWGRWGTAAWIAEGVFSAALCAYARTNFARRGVSSTWPLVVIAFCFVSMSPWLSPMKVVATLGEPTAHLLHGALVTLGFLMPGALLTWLVNRAEQSAPNAHG